jgi:hypothetical protein
MPFDVVVFAGWRKAIETLAIAVGGAGAILRVAIGVERGADFLGELGADVCDGVLELAEEAGQFVLSGGSAGALVGSLLILLVLLLLLWWRLLLLGLGLLVVVVASMGLSRAGAVVVLLLTLALLTLALLTLTLTLTLLVLLVTLAVVVLELPQPVRQKTARAVAQAAV